MTPGTLIYSASPHLRHYCQRRLVRLVEAGTPFPYGQIRRDGAFARPLSSGKGLAGVVRGHTISAFERERGVRRLGVGDGVLEELQPGDPLQVGPYRLAGVLGAGGMGRVFLGLPSVGRPVAVKVIRPELAADPEFRVRFRREVAAARAISGLYTAQLLDADTDGPVPWLATAYLDGPSLAEAVTRYGPLPVERLLTLASGLAEALAAVHAMG